jgi:L-fucose isomerase-like protein
VIAEANYLYIKEEDNMNQLPKVKVGIVAVSRDCFPESLSVTRRANLIKAYTDKYDAADIYECPICIVESEIHMVQALEDVKAAGCNALVVYLGNFGPEISETLLAKYFDGPKMFIAAAEETGDDLIGGRGDAYCGMLNASYNLKLRNVKAYIPEYPVGDAADCADMIHEFLPIARAVIGLNHLKIISFGPRPLNFLACNAPIKQLYNIGVEIEENSELDLFEAFNKHAGDERIEAVVKEMEEELGAGNKKPEILSKLAQYELTLKDWIEEHKGYRKYVAIAGKCWPAFQTQFGFVPCYVNSRLTAQGIPVSCEVDIYGALSEFIGTAVSEDAVTLLDINNSVPKDMYEQDIKGKFDYTLQDTFMGFHCGNTASGKLTSCEMKYQKIMARSLPIEVTNGTLEGDIIPGDITFFRLQSTADNILRAYIAHGEILPVASRSFGSIGVFAIPQMGRFYRHVLIEGGYPHHGAVAFGHYGKALYEVFKYIGVPVDEIGYNRPAGDKYPTENPWK